MERKPFSVSVPVPVPVPHVLIFPFPAQGHMNAMLNLTEILCLAGLHVSFFTTEHNLHQLLSFTNINSRFSHFPGFRFETYSDGLPVDQPRSPDFLCGLLSTIKNFARPAFLDLLIFGHQKSDDKTPVTCVIADGIMSFTIDVGKDLGIPVISFHTVSACSFWSIMCVPKLIDAGELPFKGQGANGGRMEKRALDYYYFNYFSNGNWDYIKNDDECNSLDTWLNGKGTKPHIFFLCIPMKTIYDFVSVPRQPDDADMDQLITCVPGMEHFLRRRDLPSFCRAEELSDPSLQFVLTEAINSIRASAHILNTFEDLEGCSLSQIRSQIPKLYSLGPLQALLNSRRENSFQIAYSNSLMEVDRSCMIWLDSQPLKSVVYVSFGSIAQLTRKELFEYWHGLVNSGKRFLWVIRSDIIASKEGENQIPTELLAGTKEKGFVVGWSPQEEVLAHPAVGGFLTHSGWNSTLESVVAGVPMLCRPYLADQQINSRLVSEVWKIGLDMKDTCDRSTVEKMVRELMDDKREELMRRSNEMAEMVKKCVSEGGSSYCNLEELVQDIKSNSLPTP